MNKILIVVRRLLALPFVIGVGISMLLYAGFFLVAGTIDRDFKLEMEKTISRIYYSNK